MLAVVAVAVPVPVAAAAAAAAAASSDDTPNLTCQGHTETERVDLLQHRRKYCPLLSEGSLTVRPNSCPLQFPSAEQESIHLDWACL